MTFISLNSKSLYFNTHLIDYFIEVSKSLFISLLTSCISVHNTILYVDSRYIKSVYDKFLGVDSVFDTESTTEFKHIYTHVSLMYSVH